LDAWFVLVVESRNLFEPGGLIVAAAVACVHCDSRVHQDRMGNDALRRSQKSNPQAP
jgi:hypothetical protein